jgi:hypothetical protein
VFFYKKPATIKISRTSSALVIPLFGVEALKHYSLS